MLFSPHISNPINGLNLLLCAQLITKPLDGHRERIFIDIFCTICPDAVNQISARHHISLIFYKQAKKLLFCFAEFYRHSIFGKLHPIKVKQKAVDLKVFCAG